VKSWKLATEKANFAFASSERCKPTIARVMPRNLTLAWVWLPASTNQFPQKKRSLCEGGLGYERNPRKQISPTQTKHPNALPAS
jgi:hypothetical protein